MAAEAFDAQFVGYLVLFGSSAVVCFLGIGRAVRIEKSDLRRGAVALLAISGAWAAFHVGYLAAPTTALRYWFYVAGLAVGIAAVGPWLYFCSAYTGRSLHLRPGVRWAAVVLYTAILAVKLTNPLHELYFTVEPATTPFSYLEIHHGPLHWVVMGLAYSLAFLGFFMLYEIFTRASYDTKPLFAVVALAGLPVVFDVGGATTPYLLEMTYSPVGVAAFTVGFFYVYFHRFEAVRMTGDREDAVVVLDRQGEVTDANQEANRVFGELRGAFGRPLGDVLPDVEEVVEGRRSVIERSVDGFTRYYDVTVNPFTAGGAELGRLLTFSDITERQRYRQELEEKNERLEEFASIVSHDLRNPLNVATGRLELAMKECDSEHLEHVETGHRRMETLIQDVLALAREGEDVSGTEPVDLSSVVRSSWEAVDAPDAELEVVDDVRVEADESRLQQLLENLFRNAVEHGGREVEASVGSLEDGFYVEDDGEGIPEDEREKVLDTGYSTSGRGTGFGLSIVERIAEAHGWEVEVTEGSSGGARFEFTGVETVET